MKKILTAALGALFLAGSVVTVADAQVALKIPFSGGAEELVHGNNNSLNISNTAVLVKAGSGYIGEYCSVGSGTGSVTIYDSATTGGVASSNELYTLATSTANACVVLEMPFVNGLVVVTGGSTTVLAVSYR